MKDFFYHLINIRENADFEQTKSIISGSVSLRGYNLWILVCSSILACIGLDTNSTAVIIGAMLISPLMSPILGFGLSLAIHDKSLLFRSLRNLFLAFGISLITSVIYFFLSPLGETTTELQARTFPTLLDVLIALFGGIAGIVSISRREQTNAIPGVAIATALMPPLCTAGFGLATANWAYFFGAFYLFFINTVFISLATYLIVRYLHFPEKEFVNTKLAQQYRKWFIILSVVALTPSIYFLYTVYRDEVVKEKIQKLVLEPIKKQGNEILKWEIEKKDSTKLIKVYHSGLQIDDSLNVAIENNLHKNNLQHYHLLSMRVNLTKEEVSKLSAEMIHQMFQDLHIEELKQQAKSTLDTNLFRNLYKETNIAFPYIDTLVAAWAVPAQNTQAEHVPLIVYKSSKSLSKKQSAQLYSYFKSRLSTDTLILIKQ